MLSPSRIREKLVRARRRWFGGPEGPAQSPPARAPLVSSEIRAAIEDMLRTPGWLAIRNELVRRNQLIWEQMMQPDKDDQEAMRLRRQLLANAGIETTIDEMLGNKEIS